MSQPTLGVMTLTLNRKTNIEELNYFRKLSILGKMMGLNVVVFTPHQATPNNPVLTLSWNELKKKWERKVVPFPSIIFDRCRYSIQDPGRFNSYLQFRKKYANLSYLNNRLANKWVIHQTLSTNSNIQPHLPKTSLYDKFSNLIDAFSKHNVWFLKPINGTGGRSILRVEQLSDGLFLIQGRDKQRRIFGPQQITKKDLFRTLTRWSQSNRYLLQQGLQLFLKNGRVHDFRVLVQKNGNGTWEMTGGAGRIGAARSVTSNLHGGGEAVSMIELLKQQHTSREIKKIEEQIETLSHQVVKSIEKKYGRLCEVALDIAIDSDGHVWLLELNQKPSREVFSKIGELDTYRKALSRPLEYALYLSNQK